MGNMIMKDQLISFETAKLAKEKGFDIPYRGYNDNGELYPSWFVNDNNYRNLPYYFAPPQSVLQKWLRDEHNIVVFVSFAYGDFGRYAAEVHSKKMNVVDGFTIFDNYEKALEEGLQEALKLI